MKSITFPTEGDTRSTLGALRSISFTVNEAHLAVGSDPTQTLKVVETAVSEVGSVKENCTLDKGQLGSAESVLKTVAPCGCADVVLKTVGAEVPR